MSGDKTPQPSRRMYEAPLTGKEVTTYEDAVKEFPVGERMYVGYHPMNGKPYGEVGTIRRVEDLGDGNFRLYFQTEKGVKDVLGGPYKNEHHRERPVSHAKVPKLTQQQSRDLGELTPMQRTGYWTLRIADKMKHLDAIERVGGDPTNRPGAGTIRSSSR